MMFFKAVVFFCGASCIAIGPAYGLITLKDEEARQYVGDARTKFTSSNYTYEILSRSHRDAMNGRFSDATLFNPGGGNFLYLRRKDGDHRLVIDSTAGREEEPVTEAAWRQRIDNALSDDNNIPLVFLDDSRKELAVIFIGKRTNVSQRLNSDGLLEIEINVPGSTSQSGRSRRRGPF
jgi:hypothetical protein